MKLQPHHGNHWLRLASLVALGLVAGHAFACNSGDPIDDDDDQDACEWTNDGMCDEPDACAPGTDTADCEEVEGTCEWQNDGECDEPDLCAPGTDAADCGSSSSSSGGSDDECNSDSDCGYKKECRSGSCYTLECTSDSHCGSCERCSDNVCRDCGEGPYGCYC
jgi:hypothetical protein